jgi:hypothetical protein
MGAVPIRVDRPAPGNGCGYGRYRGPRGAIEDPFRADITARIDTDRTIENLGNVAAISKAPQSA